MIRRNRSPPAFDFSAFPLQHAVPRAPDRRPRRKSDVARPRNGRKAASAVQPPERRAKKDRRRRIDPTTFEKQYTPDEMEFMNAMQRFKESSGKSFPTHGEVLRVAVALGYRLAIDEPDPCRDETVDGDPRLAESSTLERSE